MSYQPRAQIIASPVNFDMKPIRHSCLIGYADTVGLWGQYSTLRSSFIASALTPAISATRVRAQAITSAILAKVRYGNGQRRPPPPHPVHRCTVRQIVLRQGGHHVTAQASIILPHVVTRLAYLAITANWADHPLKRLPSAMHRHRSSPRRAPARGRGR